jgi:hypothetical protein
VNFCQAAAGMLRVVPSRSLVSRMRIVQRWPDVFPLVTLVLHNDHMSRWLRRSRARTFILACWAVTAAVVALWDLGAAIVVCLGGVYCIAIAYALAERRWWNATGMAAIGGTIVLNLVTPDSSSRVEHDVVFGVSLAASAYFLAACMADRRTQERRGQPRLGRD